MLAVVSVMCFLVVSFSSERTLRRTSKLRFERLNVCINYPPYSAKTRYPWSERDAVYPITAEEKSDILDRISLEVRKAVAQAAEQTKIHLENKEALAKNASESHNRMYATW